MEVKNAFLIIGPTSKFRLSWDIMLMILLGYIAVMTPYGIGFSVQLRPFSPMWCLETTMDLIFIVDIILNFRTGYIDEKNILIMDYRQIRKAYCRG